MSMTWKEFKAAVEAQGVTDDMTVDWIDIGSWFDAVVVDIDRSAILNEPGTSGDTIAHFTVAN